MERTPEGLRTPLASIRGYAELVRRAGDHLPPTTAHSLDRIESEAIRMTGLVEDLLLLARLDAGRPLDRSPVDLAALAVDAVMDAHAAGPEHAWSLDLPVGEDDALDMHTIRTVLEDELVVIGDESGLRQVLANLLANARTHTPPGTQVDVRLVRDRGAVVLTVSDDGPGIPADLPRSGAGVASGLGTCRAWAADANVLMPGQSPVSISRRAGRTGRPGRRRAHRGHFGLLLAPSHDRRGCDGRISATLLPL